MAKPIENVEYLAQTIGPRPAGTEEEQQAALYITEQIQKSSGLPAFIEDFNNTPDGDLPRAVLVAVPLIFAILAMFVQAMVVPALVVALICAALFAAEGLGKIKLSRLTGNGVSQNVVSKYVPEAVEGASARRRKVVLVAHYDSGKAQGKLLQAMAVNAPIFKWVSIGGMIAIPVIMLVRTFVAFGGAALLVVNVITVLAMLCAATSLMGVMLNRAAAYNDAANCNASGVAVLLEVARRIGSEVSYSASREGEEASLVREVHGAKAAEDAGLIPEEAELVYEVEPIPAVEAPAFLDESPEARLVAAKAAVAALTGKPVSASINIEFEEESSAVAVASGYEEQEDTALEAEAFESASAVDDSAKTPASIEAPETPSVAAVSADPMSDKPDWFRRAQEKARKTDAGADPAVYRSRYADALDAAAQVSASREQDEIQPVADDTEARIQKMRESIMGHRAPSFSANPVVEGAQATAATAAEAAGAAAVAGAVAAEAAPAAAVEAIAAAATGLKPARPVERPKRAGMSIPTVAEPVETPAAPVVEAVATSDEVSEVPAARKKRTIALPNIGKAPVADATQTGDGAEAAAEPAVGKTGAIRGLRSKLPSIGGLAGERAKQPAVEAEDKGADLSGFDVEVPTPAAPAEKKTRATRAMAIPAVQSEPVVVEEPEDLGSTQAFMPYDLAADEVSEEVVPEAPAAKKGARSRDLASEGYSAVPKSRVQGFLSRFSKTNERRSVREERSTPQEWLDVDSDFDARSAGAARGGWESFRQDDEAGFEDRSYRGYGGEIDAAFTDDEDGFSSKRRSRRWEGGAASREQLGRVSTRSGAAEVVPDAPLDGHVAEESVYHFRHPEIDVEVWFVALGSELAGNGGMEAFLTEHASDLRGAVMIELEGLGAGDLAVVEREGFLKSFSSTSRMRRYAAKASDELGMPLARVAIDGRETTSSYAMRKGYQALHLVGAIDGAPAYFGQAEDVVENVDEETLMRNADFVMELLKQI